MSLQCVSEMERERTGEGMCERVGMGTVRVGAVSVEQGACVCVCVCVCVWGGVVLLGGCVGAWVYVCGHQTAAFPLSISKQGDLNDMGEVVQRVESARNAGINMKW